MKRLDRDIPNVPLRKKTSLNLKSAIGGIKALVIEKYDLQNQKRFEI